jgi:predicted dienelactone hydrolase
VGVRDFTIEEAGYAVDASLWYPALNPGGEKEEITYRISDKSASSANLPVAGRALRDAPPDAAHGPYPLVIYCPGLTGWRQASCYLLEHLASHGFAVMATDTRGETFSEFWLGAATRPLDMRSVIAYADKLSSHGGAWEGLLELERLAVAGHSSGGWAALIGGGAQMHFGWGDAHPDLVAENSMSNLSQFVPHAAEIASMLGLDGAPEGLWPPQNDRRVKAVVALAPDGDIFGAQYEGVAAVKASALVITGGGDTLNVPERCAYPIYRHLGSAQKTLVTFAHAGHMIFADQCPDVPWMAQDSFWACSDAVWDMERAHDLIDHFITAFLLAELKGDPQAAEALALENVSFSGIGYETS